MQLSHSLIPQHTYNSSALKLSNFQVNMLQKLTLIHTHTHVPTQIHTHTYTHSYTHTHALISAQILSFRTPMLARRNLTNPPKNTHTDTHTYTNTHTHTDTQTHTHTHTHNHTHTH